MKGGRLARIMATALQGVDQHRLRSFLAALGLLVGVAAVVIMVAVGQGYRNRAVAQITAMGTNLISIRSAKRGFSGLRSRTTNQMASLERSDALALARLEGAVSAVPLEQRMLRISGPEGTSDSTVVAATPDVFILEDQTLAEGSFFNTRQEKSSRRVAVIGPSLRNRIAGEASLVGKTIEIKKQPFLVIGELMPKGADPSGLDLDDRLYIPLKTMQSRLLGGQRHVGLIVVRAQDEAAMLPLTQAITDLLRHRHRIKPGRPNDFRIQTQLETIEAKEESNRLFSMVITGVAAISLLVAGVGIMAVMLIAVRERTPEIGVRRAVGARRRDILLQFLAESLLLGLAGGGGGAALGLAIALAMRGLSQLNFALPWPQALAALGLSLAIALAFGLAPAKKAANLVPVDALRE